MSRRMLLVPFLVLGLAAPLHSQALDDDSVPVMAHRDLAGPRMGIAYVSGERALARLNEHGLNPTMMLFGWHFEQIIRPRAGGPMLVAQQVLMVAGLDQGTAIPSATFLLGIRTPNGFEFGMGPNLSPMGPAMAVGIGKTFRYGGVSIPVNLAIVRSPGSMRTAFTVGYAIRNR